MKNKAVISFIGLTMVGIALFGANKIYAQTSIQHQTLIDMLVSRFHLNRNDVQSVFNDFQKQRQADAQANYKARLDGLVSQGKITSAQRDLIQKEHDSLVAQKQSSDWQNLTPRQRQDKMIQQRTDLQNWAKQNNLDPGLLYLVMGGRGFGGIGMMGGFHHGGFDDDQPSSVTPAPTQ